MADELRINVDNMKEPNGKLPLDTWGSTMFEPQREAIDPAEDASPARGEPSSSRRSRAGDAAPEKKLTLFALRLAILEKSASGLGALGFIWATVVLLGGFAIALEKRDFWFVTVILLIEGARIFSRSHELEWQHQATWSIKEAGKYSFRTLRVGLRFFELLFKPFAIFQRGNSGRIVADIQRSVAEEEGGERRVDASARRTWQTADVPLLPVASWVFLSRNISRMLYWLQLMSASACVSLSLMRLAEQNYGSTKGCEERENLPASLNIFYGLALAEALMFLAEKAYWEYMVSNRRLLEQVNRECNLGPTGMISVRRFFYDAYSRCIEGSIFDGLKMDLVSFAQELLESHSQDEQLIGARILHRFATHRRFANETLRKIGTSLPVIERLIEMLNWESPAEAEIRQSAAHIVSQLAGQKHNALRVAGIPGAMESISSLLYCGVSRSLNVKPHEVVRRSAGYRSSELNLLGLLILKNLAHDHDNCGKMGNTRGLLAKIVEFTGVDREEELTVVKPALQLLKLLASTTGQTGKILRHEISEIVFTLSNIREVLKRGETQPELQKLGVEVLTSLAMDENAREKIGGTGSVIGELLRVFFVGELKLSAEAGEALAMLALENDRNCRRILEVDGVVEKLASGLTVPALRVNASRILHNLFAYADTDISLARLRPVVDDLSTVLRAVMMEEMKLLEVSIGLAAQALRFASPENLAHQLQRAEIPESEFVQRLVMILKNYSYPSIKVPRIRRFIVELSIVIMKLNSNSIQLFKQYGMEKEFKSVAETTTELECFNVFSGNVGLSRHKTSISSLLVTALELINQV